jgi:choice-of-anchor A domain-containing protein
MSGLIGLLFDTPAATADWLGAAQLRNEAYGEFVDAPDISTFETLALPTGMENPSVRSRSESFSAESAFSMAAPARLYPLRTIRLKNRNLSITGSGQTTLNLRNLVLRGGTLTLRGTAETTFIINVRNQFSLLNSAKIVLTGGVDPSDVLFNIIGTGQPVTIGQRSSVAGSIVSIQRMVGLASKSEVVGEVIAKKIHISGGSQIIHLPVASP